MDQEETPAPKKRTLSREKAVETAAVQTVRSEPTAALLDAQAKHAALQAEMPPVVAKKAPAAARTAAPAAQTPPGP